MFPADFNEVFCNVLLLMMLMVISLPSKAPRSTLEAPLFALEVSFLPLEVFNNPCLNRLFSQFFGVNQT